MSRLDRFSVAARRLLGRMRRRDAEPALRTFPFPTLDEALTAEGAELYGRLKAAAAYVPRHDGTQALVGPDYDPRPPALRGARQRYSASGWTTDVPPAFERNVIQVVTGDPFLAEWGSPRC